MNNFCLYLRYLLISIRGQMQYPASFILQTASHGMLTALEVVGIWALFTRFGRMGSWTLPQICLFYGFIAITFSLADALGRGFDSFSSMVRTGEFDRLLLRPRSCVLQIMGQELTLKRVGRFTQGAIVFIWAWHQLQIPIAAANLLLVAYAVACGVCLFLGLLIMQATMCFWSTESLEMWNVLTYGGVEAAQYPMSEYRPTFRRFFTFIVPLACIGYFPIVQLIGRPDPTGTRVLFRLFAPLAGVAFLLISLQIWKLGIRRYTSTGV